ncbi:unnamed protein product [Cladocopium goreaui]|uniref:SET domain-containing protein n=1 Tax=Cladocopium goreaui TaxID=2562237 RepID=A0A9P1FET0_9DINO|nr:unnamed protein product [Cladocopium goreaui]
MAMLSSLSRPVLSWLHPSIRADAPRPRISAQQGCHLRLERPALALAVGITSIARLSGRQRSLRRAVVHGVERRIPQGSTVYLTGVSPELEGEPCEVLSFDLARRFWLVRFLHPRFNDRRALVPEQGLSFGYCVMPESILLSSAMVRECEDFSGRGLEVTADICKGQMLFEESPFFITADDVNEVIRAFFMLKAQAAKAKDALQGE